MKQVNRVSVLAGLVLGFIVLVGVMLLAQPAANASGGAPEWFGVVIIRPAGITGIWVVGAKSFEANGGTQVEETNGPLNVGVCARVRYQSTGGINTASNIASQEPYKCGLGGGDHGEHMKVYSYVNALPASFPLTLTGEWVIGNISYTAVITTRFEQAYGAFALNQCVGVEYISGTQRLAIEIQTEPAYKCSGLPGGGPLPRAVIRGVLDAFPPSLVGTWTVSGTIYTATANTQFEQEHGPFFVGGCVQVQFNPANKIIFEVSTEDAWKCGGPKPAELQLFGVITSIPAGTLGDWIIGGNSFVVTATTVLTTEHGPLAVGTCAEVEYILSGTDRLATKIGSENMFKCGMTTFTNVAIGRISSFPSSLFGTWVITRNGGFTDTFQADMSTEFNQEQGSFAPGACVKVKYFVSSGVNRAVEIETEGADDCGESKPPVLPGMNIVFAQVSQFPTVTPPVGLWVIGGAPYSATSATKFGEQHGPFAVGACVKALYSVVSGTNVLHQVQTKDDAKCVVSGTIVYRAYGPIEVFPPGLVGEWRIGGISYTASISTEFEQNHGFFAVGAFVEVKYISGTPKLALSIETHVAPGAGRQDVTGVLEAHDFNDDWSSWRVNGVEYKADPAIEVKGFDQSLSNGPAATTLQRVKLNVYSSADGTLYATSATAIQAVFLPVVFR